LPHLILFGDWSKMIGDLNMGNINLFGENALNLVMKKWFVLVIIKLKIS
jgi:hypothetical protein